MSDAYLGIDIAKRDFHATLLIGEIERRHVFPNNDKGFAQLDAWLINRKVDRVHACMEATGAYAEAVATHLVERGHLVSIVNPARIKGYAQSELSRTKTDAVDAGLIARFCRALKPDAWMAPAPEIRHLQGLVRRLESLTETRQQELNRAQAPGMVDPVAHSIAALVAHLSEQIDALQRQIREHIDRHPTLRQQRDLLASIPGIGHKTVASILGELPDINQFASAKQVAAYAGLSVAQHRSGTSIRGRARLSKRGNHQLRKALFFPAMVAMRCNPIIHAFALRLRAAGKREMVILGAAMRKLLHLVFGVLRSGKPFNANYDTILA